MVVLLITATPGRSNLDQLCVWNSGLNIFWTLSFNLAFWPPSILPFPGPSPYTVSTLDFCVYTQHSFHWPYVFIQESILLLIIALGYCFDIAHLAVEWDDVIRYFSVDKNSPPPIQCQEKSPVWRGDGRNFIWVKWLKWSSSNKAACVQLKCYSLNVPASVRQLKLGNAVHQDKGEKFPYLVTDWSIFMQMKTQNSHSLISPNNTAWLVRILCSDWSLWSCSDWLVNMQIRI